MKEYLSTLQDNITVIILHVDFTSRLLQNAIPTALPSYSPTSTPTITIQNNGPSEFQISQYQICLWSGFVVLLLLYAAIYGIANMEVIPDSLLFAKYQSIRTSKND